MITTVTLLLVIAAVLSNTYSIRKLLSCIEHNNESLKNLHSRIKILEN